VGNAHTSVQTSDRSGKTSLAKCRSDSCESFEPRKATLTVLIGLIVGWTFVVPILVLAMAMTSARRRERLARVLESDGLGQVPVRLLAQTGSGARPARLRSAQARLRYRCTAEDVVRSEAP
jgi:hypothetical protein